MTWPEGPGYRDPEDAGDPVSPEATGGSGETGAGGPDDIHNIFGGLPPGSKITVELPTLVHPVTGKALRDREPTVRAESRSAWDPMAAELAKRGLALGAGTAVFVYVAPNIANDVAALAADGYILFKLGKIGAGGVNYVRQLPTAWRNSRDNKRSHVDVPEGSTASTAGAVPAEEYKEPITGPATPAPTWTMATDAQPPQPNDHKVAKGVGVGAAVVGGLIASRSLPHALDVVGTLGVYSYGLRKLVSLTYDYAIEPPLEFIGKVHREIRPKKSKITNPGVKK